MQFLVTGRQAGKTWAAVEWVRRGKKTGQYPGWSRVLLVPTIQDAERIRRRERALNIPNEEQLDYRQVFSYSEWKHARVPMRHEIQVMVDDLDRLLSQILGFQIDGATLTGVPLANPQELAESDHHDNGRPDMYARPPRIRQEHTGFGEGSRGRVLSL